MTSTTFIDKQTVIQSAWLNDVNAKVYGTFTSQYFTGTGSQLVFNLPAATSAPSVHINGVWQQRNSYTLAGKVLTFSEAPPYGTVIEVLS
jgi:hypothetical protein